MQVRNLTLALLAISMAGALCLPAQTKAKPADNTAAAPVEALIYSTMPSTFDHSPTMAMDHDSATYFKSVYGMADGDDFLVMLSRPIPVTSISILTGDPDGDDELTNGFVETSPDSVHYKHITNFSSSGVAGATFPNLLVSSLRIRVNQGQGVPRLIVREISIDSPVSISHVQIGPGRGFYDISHAPDVADWAKKAESQMESFWPDTQAMLYSYKFITPNMVNVVYRTGPDVTPVAATGGGVMTVNANWCRKHPEDTGLTVHETTHVIQAMSGQGPGWLIEGTADYIRWVKFEPQNFTYRIDPAKSTYHDAYRTTAAFLGWCELHYDSTIVTKLNDAMRFGKYSDALWKTYCGKSVDALWTEFLAAYEANPKTVLAAAVAPADAPRELPVVSNSQSVPQDLSTLFNVTGIYKDGSTFDSSSGVDGEGAAYSGQLLGPSVTTHGVKFNLGPDGANDLLTCTGNTIPLNADNATSIWLLATAVEGNQMRQTFTINYADGSTQTLYQNFSDWFDPQSYPGEVRAVKMPYRLMSAGAKDPRTFNLYAYGFSLRGGAVKSITCPNNSNIKIAAITLAD